MHDQPRTSAREFANGLQLALDTTPDSAPWAWVNRDGLREVIALLRGLTSDQQAVESNLNDAHDWLIRFANAYDASISRHYFHICDGQHKTCGCPWEGNDDPR